jgi:hypothetical protein
MSSWSISVVCANGMGRPWINFFSIVKLLVLYGMLSSFTLGCHGLCLIKWLICLLPSGPVVILVVLSCGDNVFLPYAVLMEGT